MFAAVKNLFSSQPKRATADGNRKTLSGTLELLTLFDLLLSLNQNGHSGELHISYSDSEEASIFILKGQPCHALVSGLTGEVAIVDIFIKADNDPNASFYFEAANHFFDSDKVTITTKTKELLFKVALELDHHRKLN